MGTMTKSGIYIKHVINHVSFINNKNNPLNYLLNYTDTSDGNDILFRIFLFLFFNTDKLYHTNQSTKHGPPVLSYLLFIFTQKSVDTKSDCSVKIKSNFSVLSDSISFLWILFKICNEKCLQIENSINLIASLI